MSAFPLLDRLARHPACAADRGVRSQIGQALGDVAVLRSMSLSLAERLSRGETPNLEAAVVKELGVSFEQSVPELARTLLAALPEDAPAPADLVALLQATLEIAPTYSLRGGTREIMQG